MAEWVIEVDDPRRDDVRALLEQHLALMYEITPPEDVYALDVEALVGPAITFYSLRVGGEVLGVGALRQLDPQHAEVKSMHTAKAARGRGYGDGLGGGLPAGAPPLRLGGVRAVRAVRRLRGESEPLLYDPSGERGNVMAVYWPFPEIERA